jgi:HD-like signal output (HDOD) protein
MLAKRWAFPEHLIDCIRDHHNPAAEPSAMMDCLRVADQVVRLPRGRRQRQSLARNEAIRGAGSLW